MATRLQTKRPSRSSFEGRMMGCRVLRKVNNYPSLIVWGSRLWNCRLLAPAASMPFATAESVHLKRPADLPYNSSRQALQSPDNPLPS